MPALNDFEDVVGRILLSMEQAKSLLLESLPEMGGITEDERKLKWYHLKEAEALLQIALLETKRLAKMMNAVVDNVP